jgi:hypothetical protein
LPAVQLTVTGCDAALDKVRLRRLLCVSVCVFVCLCATR